MPDYSWYKPRESAAQKFGRALRRGAIAVAGLGALGGGYQHYGTQDTLTATVTSVESLSAKDRGAAPRLVVHTDKGTFVNDASFLHFKGAKTAAAIALQIRPQMRLTFKVYGAHPTLFGFSPDNLGLYRNILSVAAPQGGIGKAPAPAAAAPVPAPVAAPLRGTPPAGPLTVEGVAAEADENLPQVCADNARLDDMKGDVPQAYRDLAYLERLPLTGKPVFDAVTSRANMVRTCLLPYNEASAALGVYSDKSVRILRGTTSYTAFHEYFHALQDINGSRTGALGPDDAVIANALSEATAVGYELMTRKEAKNRGLALFEDPHHSVVNGVSVTSGVGTSETNAGLRLVFDRAYDRAFAGGAGLAADAREAAALQAGGKAVVRALMFGDDNDWLRGYARQAAENVNRNAAIYGANDTGAANYPLVRRTVFEQQGRLGGLSLMPEEFLGDDAPLYVQRCMRIMGLNVAPAPAAARRLSM